MHLRIFYPILAALLFSSYSVCALAASKTETSKVETTTETIPLSKLQDFVQVMEEIKTYYVEEVSTDELFEHAMSGMVHNLDPHSAYLREDDFADLRISTTGKFGGLGIEVTMEDDYVMVIAPIDDTPAAKAGLKSGDIIIRIDDKTVKGLSLREAVTAMRGPEGSAITLTVVREGVAEPIEFKLYRAEVKVQNVKASMISPGYAYVRITHFQENTGREVEMAINKLRKENGAPFKGLILDLRNNPGGVLEAAVDVSNDFLNSDQLNYNKLIVYTKSRVSMSQLSRKATGRDMINGAPMIILVNNGTASAAEIVAGALQDHKRAVLMGDQTFGKGSVQTVIPLNEDHALKLTTAYYYTPSGRSIQDEGIEPDIELDNTEITIKTERNGSIREIDLPEHIDEADILVEDNKIKEEFLPADDYQVIEALNVLKAIDSTKRRHTP